MVNTVNNIWYQLLFLKHSHRHTINNAKESEKLFSECFWLNGLLSHLTVIKNAKIGYNQMECRIVSLFLPRKHSI